MSRLKKVSSLIREEFSSLVRQDVELPSGSLVTVSEVVTSPDLMEAKVFLSIVPKNKEEEILELIKKEIYFLQGELNHKLRMKRTPKLSLYIDHREQRAARIEQLIKQEHADE
ncbi:30S ribosome-binding factor RbfA [Patescibacteria group bacterium]|nr:30S ribosome-binding factor RbfA [Patescibacteria group bacterium]